MWSRTAVALLLIGAVAVAQEEWELKTDSLEREIARCYEQMEELKEELSLQNLVNGLYLSRKQLEQLISLAREAGELRDRTAERKAELVSEFVETLEELRSHLRMPQGTIPPECEKKVNQLEHELREARRAYFAEMEGLQKRLHECLSRAQQVVVGDFNPCLIPPKELKDPVRVGQAEGELTEVIMHLDHLRNMPRRPLELLLEPLVDQLMCEWDESLGKQTAEEKAQDRRTILEAVHKARELSDVEYLLQREELAREVTSRFARFQEELEKAAEVFHRFSGGLDTTGKYLLNPRIIPILQRELVKLAADSGPAPWETGAEEAPSCDDAACALDEGKEAPTRCACGKLTLAGFARQFELPAEHFEAAKEELGKAQIKLLKLLCEPTDDGDLPLVALFTGDPDAWALLSEAPAGGELSYAMRGEQLKARLHKVLRQWMPVEAFRRYLKSGVDIFEVHVGNLNRFEKTDGGK